MNSSELKIIDMALDSLEHNPLFKGMWKFALNMGNDVEISLYARDRTLKYKTETRQEVRIRHLNQILDIAKTHKPLMLVAGKIYPDVKEALRQNNIPYLEANGNISIQDGDLFIWVDSNKPVVLNKGKSNRAFTKTGLKVVFHFLLNERFLNLPYREIAELSGTSLGNVTNVMNSLKETGFITKKDSGDMKLTNKKRMLDRWMNAYEQILKPTIEVGTFRFINEHDYETWRRVPLENKKSLWGGEAGAHLLTGQLRPQNLIIYTNENRNEFLAHYRLIRDPNGYIKVYEKFWNYDDYKSNIAPPLLVYADLMSTGDKKSTDAAERVYDELLKTKIEDPISAFANSQVSVFG